MSDYSWNTFLINPPIEKAIDATTQTIRDWTLDVSDRV